VAERKVRKRRDAGDRDGPIRSVQYVLLMKVFCAGLRGRFPDALQKARSRIGASDVTVSAPALAAALTSWQAKPTSPLWLTLASAMTAVLLVMRGALVVEAANP